MKIISLIDTHAVIEKILRHLNLWDRAKRPPPPPPEKAVCYDIDVVSSDDAAQWFHTNQKSNGNRLYAQFHEPTGAP